MSKIKRLHRRVTRILYHRGFTVHGEYLGLFLGLLVMVFLSYLASTPSIHADYGIFNPSTGDVSVNYSIAQKPTFDIDTNGFDGKIVSTTVTTIDGRSASVTPQIAKIDNGTDYSVTLNPAGQPETGRYKIAVAIKDGLSTRTVTQDFTWGVLAINMAKSSYQPKEPVSIDMAVLDDNGITLCSADTKVEITAPNGSVTTLTTSKKQISVSSTCQDGNVTANPDYIASYIPQQTGHYTVDMSTTTIRGMRSLESGFDVMNHADFVSERVNTAMRLYPASPYDVTLDIHANKAFTGAINEPYPDSFSVTKPLLTVIKANGQKTVLPKSDFRIDVQGSIRTLHWDGVVLQPGDTAQLTYTYKPPAVSPAFYQLGPAYLTNTTGKKVFQEPRAWQLAGDAVDDVTVLWDTATGAIPTGWTCVSCVSGDPMYQLFPYANTTYAGTGGGPESVSHTLTFASETAGAASANMNTLLTGKNEPSLAHTHTWPTTTTSSVDNKPVYKDLQFIRASNPLGLPAGAIAMFDVTSTAGLPTNWTSYGALNDPNNTGTAGNGVYLRGENNNSTGGAATHTTAISSTITSGVESGTTAVNNSGAVAAASTTHTHTIAAQSLAAEPNDPQFISVVFAKLSVANDAIPNGMIAFFDNTTMPLGWSQPSTIGGTNSPTGRLLKGSLTAGTIGGSLTHTPGGTATLVFTSSAPSSTGTGPSGNVLGQTTVASSTHTHNVTFNVSAATAMPNYRSMILGKFATINVSGTVYSDEGTTTLGSVGIKMALNGVAERIGTVASNGTYTLPVPDPGPGGVITTWLTGTQKAATVTRSAGTGTAITGLNLYQNHLIVRHEDAGPISNSDISKCTKTLGTAGVCADSSLHFDVASSNLTVDNDTALYVWAGKTFTPGGTVMLSPGGTAASTGGDLEWGSSASTLNIGTNALNVGGDWNNTAGGTFTKSTGQTTTMTGTVTGLSVISSSKRR
jgi:hypothetical protein